MEKKSVLSVGLAMFTMLYGAGNVIYPLVLGAATGMSVWYGLIGFLVTAVLVPAVGFIAALLCDADYSKFLRHLGRWPGAVVTFFAMMLIGPLCVVPRCIDLSFSLLHPLAPGVGAVLFSVLAGGVIFLGAIKRDSIVSLFGKYLGPLKIALLTLIVVKGLLTPAVRVRQHVPAPRAMWLGLVDGYLTMDLLAGILFVGLLAAALFQATGSALTVTEEKKYPMVKTGSRMVLVAAACLTAVYWGFSLLASRFSGLLVGQPPSELFSILSHHILGNWGAAAAGVIITLTCLTTAIVVCAIFADYVRVRLLRGKISYSVALMLTAGLAATMTFLGFEEIMALVEPIVVVAYPLLIVLAIVVIGVKLLRKLHTPIFAAARAHRDEEHVRPVRSDRKEDYLK